jgi:TetR/AcrR family transcriptional repressor of mexJK operon
MTRSTSTSGAPTPLPRTRRSSAKRDAIAEAAAQRFLAGGYLGTTVEEIAAHAGVAKQTVYEHFGGKEQLFTEIMLNTIDEVGRPFFERLAELEEADDVQVALGGLARELIAVAKEPRLLELRRLIIGEAARFPKLSGAFYERGPGRTADALALKFKRLAERGILRIDDIHDAAQQFNWLVLSDPINRAMFNPSIEFDDGELEHRAQEAVRIFLAAYGGRER